MFQYKISLTMSQKKKYIECMNMKCKYWKAKHEKMKNS